MVPGLYFRGAACITTTLVVSGFLGRGEFWDQGFVVCAGLPVLMPSPLDLFVVVAPVALVFSPVVERLAVLCSFSV